MKLALTFNIPLSWFDSSISNYPSSEDNGFPEVMIAKIFKLF